MSRVDLSRPYERLGREKDPDYIRQDGKIYVWSESNLEYGICPWDLSQQALDEMPVFPVTPGNPS